MLALILLLVPIAASAESPHLDDEVDALVLLQTQAKKADVNGTDVTDGPNGAKPEAKSSHLGLILRYMPEHKTAICACAKCGSTSLFNWVYENHFGREWHSGGSASVQAVEDDNWNGKFIVVKDKSGQEEVFQKAFTYALVRDPKERLVSSWKSKVSCQESLYGTDKHAREGIVESLLHLWGRKDSKLEANLCMDLATFASILKDVHQDGNAYMLNAHFMPQTLGCFARQAPEKWSQVVDVVAPDPFSGLAKHLDFNNLPEHKHASTGTVDITEKEAELLDEITAPEYKLLEPYLTRASSVTAGKSV